MADGLGIWIKNFNAKDRHHAKIPEKNTKTISFHFCAKILKGFFEGKISWWKSRNITANKITIYGKICATKTISLSKNKYSWAKL